MLPPQMTPISSQLMHYNWTKWSDALNTNKYDRYNRKSINLSNLCVYCAFEAFFFNGLGTV